jgi:predicted O-methyltransferase YrrM
MPHRPWGPAAPAAGLPPVLTAITPEETERLGELAKGRRVLEIGAAHGYSAIAMAAAGAEHVVSVDPHEQMGTLGPMLANLNAAGVDERVTIVQDISARAMPRLAAAGERFGLVFLDGDHTLPVVTAEIAWSGWLLEPGGYLAVHDYGEDCCCPDVRQAIDQAGLAGATAGTLWTWPP